jgi:SNF2 family DNA or RNA helicase
MNIDGYTYLFYDKYCGNHSYGNPLTIDITFNDISLADETLEGYNAIKYFNKEYESFAQIPEDLDKNIYTITLCKLKKKNKCVVFKVIGINVKLFEFELKKKTITNENFLRNTMNFHRNYVNNCIKSTRMMDKVKTYSIDIISRAINPNADITDKICDEPNFTKVKMFDYQKRTVNWARHNEINKRSIVFSIMDELILGNVIYSYSTNTFMLSENKEKITFKGGALIDEVGLGKTYQMIVHSLTNPATNISYYREKTNLLHSRATLILCPSQLCGQWQREFKKMLKSDYKITVIPMMTKIHHDKYTYLDLLDADFVVVSFNFLGNNCYIDRFLKDVSPMKTYSKSLEFDHTIIDSVLEKKAIEHIEDFSKLTETRAILSIINWHRIIIDEIHEVFTLPKYKHVENQLPHIHGDYKWAVTGTPFDKNPDTLIKMIHYSTDYTTNIGSKILACDSVKEFVSNEYFRRNTKKSVENEYRLEPLKEKLIYLKFSQIERMVYNAYLANPTIDKFSVLMRQLCCHPKIADELKNSISNCKTLDDIQKIMLSHYDNDMKKADTDVRFNDYRIQKTKYKIRCIEFKRMRRFLKKMNYTVIVDFPVWKKNEDYDKMDLYNDPIDDADDADDTGDDSDDSDDINDENNANDEKSIIYVNEETYDKNISKIKKKLNDFPSIVLQNLKIILISWQDRLDKAKKILDGTNTTYTFFSNVMEKLKKVSEIVKKYDTIEDKNSDSNSDDEDNDDDKDDSEVCGICMGEITGNDVGVTKCGHIFCYNCLKQMVIQSNKCPTCLKPVKINQIFMMSYEKQYSNNVSRELKDKISLVNTVGTKLANLMIYIKSINEKCIIFSQWDSLLIKVGAVLSAHGIKNVFCRGNVWTKDKAIRDFSSNDDIQVIMLSSESAASGTNLTAASQVILLDPVYGSYEFRRNTEWQAIGRAYRTGQVKPVTVVRFIIKDTVESEIYELNKIEDSKLNIKINVFELEDTKLDIDKVELEKMTDMAASIIKHKAEKQSKKKLP